MKNFHLIPFLLGSVLAKPTPQYFPPEYCQIKYTVDSVKHVQGDQITGDYTVPGNGQLSAGSAFETSVTVTVGADLGLNFDDIISAGVSGSVSTTTTKQVSQGATNSCPDGPWHCALAILPDMTEVSGQKQAANDACEDDIDGPLPAPYTVRFPTEGTSGSNTADVEICTCQNFKHWADDGHIARLCNDCPL